MIAPIAWAVVALGALTPLVTANPEDGLPSYHYGAPIPVECMNRNSETGEHVENEKHEIEWKPFPVCNETGRPLEFNYGTEGEVNCTIAMIDDPFFHLLEFYIHSDAPLSCRIPARPAAEVEVVGEKVPEREYVPVVFALAGTLQLSHIHISTHMNVLLHSTPKHHTHAHDSGVLDSAIAYSTSPLHHLQGSHTKIGHWRSIAAEPICAMVSYTGTAQDRRKGRMAGPRRSYLREHCVLQSRVLWRWCVVCYYVHSWCDSAQKTQGTSSRGCDTFGIWSEHYGQWMGILEAE